MHEQMADAGGKRKQEDGETKSLGVFVEVAVGEGCGARGKTGAAVVVFVADAGVAAREIAA